MLAYSLDFAVATTYGGIVILDRQGRLKYIFNKDHGLQDNTVKAIFEDYLGNLWLISSVGNIIRVEFPFGIDWPAVKPCNLENKLCNGDIYLNVVAGHVVFASNKGLFCYDEKTGRFIPDLLLGKEFAYGPEGKPVFRIIQDNDRNTWFESESRNYRVIPGPGNSFTIEGGPFRRLPLAQVNAIYQGDDDRYIWFAGAEGLSRYDRTAEFKWDREFPALIQNVFCNVDTAVLGGYRNNFQPDKSLALASFTYDNRNISFFCGAPFFEGESNLSFGYMLEGYSDKWSEWTPESRKHFTNLDAGQYTFRVRAKNIYDVISKEVFAGVRGRFSRKSPPLA